MKQSTLEQAKRCENAIRFLDGVKTEMLHAGSPVKSILAVINCNDVLQQSGVDVKPALVEAFNKILAAIEYAKGEAAATLESL